MSKHTPGPWGGGLITQGQPIGDEVMQEMARQRGKTLGAIYTEDGRFLAIIASTEETVEEDRANARLIAAAPEMFEALIYTREALGNPIPIGKRHIARKIDAALAKARANDEPDGPGEVVL